MLASSETTHSFNSGHGPAHLRLLRRHLSFIGTYGMKYEERDLQCGDAPQIPAPDVHAFHPSIGSIIEAGDDGLDQFGPGTDFIRVTDDQ